MPKRIIELSDVQVKKAKAREKQYTMFDGNGLYVLITPTGGKLWRMKYRFGGKEKLLSFDTYPEITLADARQHREEARKLLANGIDPGALKKSLKEAQTEEKETFEIIAREWHVKFTPTWSPGHAVTIKSRLERDFFPWIGARPIKDVKAPELLAVLRRVESRGALESAHRIRTIAGQVFRYAVATGRAERDISGDLRGALPQPTEKHQAAITDPKEFADLLRVIDDYKGGIIVRSALQLQALWFVRPGELRHAE